MSRSPSPASSHNSELEDLGLAEDPNSDLTKFVVIKSDLLLSQDDDSREEHFETQYADFINAIHAAENIEQMYNLTIERLCQIFPDYPDLDAEGKKKFPDYRNYKALENYIKIGSADSRKNFCISLIKGAFFAIHEKNGLLKNKEDVQTQSSIFIHVLNIEACEGGAISSVEKAFFGGSEVWKIAGEEFIRQNRLNCHLGNQAHLPAWFNFVNNRKTDDNFYRLPGLDFTMTELDNILQDIALCHVKLVIRDIAGRYIELIRKANDDSYQDAENLPQILERKNDLSRKLMERTIDEEDAEKMEEAINKEILDESDDIFTIKIYEALTKSSNSFLRQVARSNKHMGFSIIDEEENPQKYHDDAAAYLLMMLLKAEDIDSNLLRDVHVYLADQKKLDLVLRAASFAVKSMEVPLWLQKQINEEGGLENLIAETVNNPGFAEMVRREVRYAKLPERAEEITLQRLISDGATHEEIARLLEDPANIPINTLLSVKGLLFHPERGAIVQTLNAALQQFPDSFDFNRIEAFKKAIELGDRSFLSENFDSLAAFVINTNNSTNLGLDLHDIKYLFHHIITHDEADIDSEKFIESLLSIRPYNADIALHLIISPQYLEYFGYKNRAAFLRDVCQNSSADGIYNLLNRRNNAGYTLPMIIAQFYPQDFKDCLDEMSNSLTDEQKKSLFITSRTNGGVALPVLVARFCPANFNEFFAQQKDLIDDAGWQDLATSMALNGWTLPMVVVVNCDPESCKNFFQNLKEKLSDDSKNKMAFNIQANRKTFLTTIAEINPDCFEEALDMLKDCKTALLSKRDLLLSAVSAYCPRHLGKTLLTLMNAAGVVNDSRAYMNLYPEMGTLLLMSTIRCPEETLEFLQRLTKDFNNNEKKNLYFYIDPRSGMSLLANISFNHTTSPEIFDYTLGEIEKLVKDGAINSDEILTILGGAENQIFYSCVKLTNTEAAIKFRTTMKEKFGIDLNPTNLPMNSVEDPQGSNVAGSRKRGRSPDAQN